VVHDNGTDNGKAQLKEGQREAEMAQTKEYMTARHNKETWNGLWNAVEAAHIGNNKNCKYKRICTRQRHWYCWSLVEGGQEFEQAMTINKRTRAQSVTKCTDWRLIYKRIRG
jgi:hypothetical protein